MRIFRKVAIVGTGLIGGSLALAIKKKRLCAWVVGVSRKKSTLALAKKKGAIDQGSCHLGIIRAADLVILATPVSMILKQAPIIKKLIKRDCLVTDVGSTKEQIVSKLEKFFKHYVGSHPLAGSEKRGMIHADAKIFKGTLCILTPTKKTDRQDLRKIKKLWEALGAKVVSLGPLNHDRALSFISHLPHIAAFCLMQAVPAKYLPFASSGLKDSTRIAASDSRLWEDIFLSNQKNILASISSFQDSLSRIKSAISRKDKRLLSAILKSAKAKREILG
jgi:prephenate dehydrogenase